MQEQEAKGANWKDKTPPPITVPRPGHADLSGALKYQLDDMRLVDFKVRILTPQAGTEAITRVMIESADKTGERWSTVGVSGNIIDASYEALNDAITWKLLKSRGN